MNLVVVNLVVVNLMFSSSVGTATFSIKTSYELTFQVIVKTVPLLKRREGDSKTEEAVYLGAVRRR